MRHFFLIILALFAVSSVGAVTLPSIFSDGMVLQRNSEIVVWGWAKTIEPITVIPSWSGEEVRTKADSDGNWSVKLRTPEGSQETYEIEVRGYNWLKISNVMIGEVILCSGQSNMEWEVGAGCIGKDSLVAQATQNDIRMFNVDYRATEYPCHDATGKWYVTTPENVNKFSAIGYVAATRIEKELGVPVGIINSSWGGTAIAAWTPKSAYDLCDYLTRANEEITDDQWGPVRPGVIYNAKIAPLTRYKIAGVLWYQGEKNCEGGTEAYTDMMFTYINEMRVAFNNDKLPFVFAQIAPNRDGWGRGALLRDKQRRALEVPNTAMVVIGALGDTADIHPRKKIEAGVLFGNAALSLFYGRTEFKYAAPLFKEAKYVKNKAIVSFSNAEGLHCRGSKTPNWFEIASADGVFYPAKAVLRKDGTVELTAKQVKAPAKVRYGWADTALPNLFNANGVQASCFITD